MKSDKQSPNDNDISNCNIENNIPESNYIDIIISQTDYTREIAEEKLKLFNNDYMLVIKDYLGIGNKKEKSITLNQQIYKEIRNYLY